MDDKLKGLIKDAGILTIITFISGFLLAFVFQITKEPIAVQAQKKKMDAYNTVFKKAKEFKPDENTEKLMLNSKEIVGSQKYGKVGIEEILSAKDDAGANLGYVVTAYSDEGYGGKIRISMGYDTKDKAITSINILEASETAGLGAKIAEPTFYQQYTNKKANPLVLVKSKSSKEEEIQAISGATISSTAVTNAVNAVLATVGGGNEK